jgi:Glycosyl transferase family 2
MRKTPLVSILIPCNNPEFLYQTLESIRNQKYENIEIIVVLDGIPEPKSPDLVRLCQSLKINYEINPGSGIVDALNFGIKVSQGRYIARIDADDLMMEHRLTDQIAILEGDPEIAVVGGQMKGIDKDGNFIKYIKYPTSFEEVRSEILRHSAVPHPGATFRKISVEEVGCYRKQFQYVEDWDLWVRLSEKWKITNLSSVVTQYRFHSLQTSIVNTVVQTQRMQLVQISHLLRNRGLPDLPPPDIEQHEWISLSLSILGELSEREEFVFLLSQLSLEIKIRQETLNDWRMKTSYLPNLKILRSIYCIASRHPVLLVQFLLKRLLVRPERLFDDTL